MKKLFIFTAIVLLMAAFTLPAFAESNVTYEGKAQEFIFAPGSEYSPTDLFENFKDVMPGDSITQQIRVKNEASKKVNVKIYMKSYGAQLGTDDFLKMMTLNVKENEKTELFDAPANETAQLTDWVCLGTFKSGADVLLDVTLDVSKDLDVEQNGSIGYVDWEFKVEEYPIPGPKTGDSSNIWLYVGIIAAALAVIAVVVILLKKRNEAK